MAKTQVLEEGVRARSLVDSIERSISHTNLKRTCSGGRRDIASTRGERREASVYADDWIKYPYQYRSQAHLTSQPFKGNGIATVESDIFALMMTSNLLLDCAEN
jgi:hypothetical protein